MKNLLVANVNKKNKRYSIDNMEPLVKAQIENSLEIGWQPNDIILLTNFKFEFMSVKATEITLNDFCWTGSKMFGIQYVLNNCPNDVVWAHDLDAWQNVWFDCPDF